MRKLLVILCGVALLGAVGQANAIPIPIVNPGFDDLVLSDGDWAPGNIPGWNLGAPAQQGTFNPSSTLYPGGVPSEDNVAYLNSSLIGQYLIGQVLTADTNYLLKVEVGSRTDVGLAGYRTVFGAGDPSVSGSFVPLAWDDNTLTVPSGGFGTSTVTYRALPGDPNLGQTLGIQLYSYGVQANFDNVRLSTAPEPTGVLLLGSGLLGLGLVGRRKFFKQG